MVDKKTTKIIGVKPNESKEAYFIRIAQPRVKNILKAIRILGNCSNRNNYAYSQEQVNLIDITLSNALTDVISKFTPSKKEQESFEFNL